MVFGKPSASFRCGRFIPDEMPVAAKKASARTACESSGPSQNRDGAEESRKQERGRRHRQREPAAKRCQGVLGQWAPGNCGNLGYAGNVESATCRLIIEEKVRIPPLRLAFLFDKYRDLLVGDCECNFRSHPLR
jgi:hypothetical protein